MVNECFVDVNKRDFDREGTDDAIFQPLAMNDVEIVIFPTTATDMKKNRVSFSVAHRDVLTFFYVGECILPPALSTAL